MLQAYARLIYKQPDFARLWWAQVISLLGDWFDTIVLTVLVAQYSDHSPLALSGFLLTRLIPPLLISPYAGVLADRFNRQRLMIMSDLLRACVVLVMLTASDASRLWIIYLMTVFQFSLSAIFEASQSSIIPNLVPAEDLVTANTLSSVTWSVMLAVGAIVGGIVAEVLGTGAALSLDSASFVLSALFISRIRSYHPAGGAETTFKKPVSERTFADGLRFLAANPAVAMTLLIKLAQSIGNVDALMSIYATQIFVLGDGGKLSLGIFYATFGCGALLGPLVLNRFNDGSVRGMRRLVAVGFAWMTLGWLVFGGAQVMPVVAFAMLVRGMGGSANWTYSSVLIQKSVPDEYLGRMFALDMAGFRASSIVSIFLTGLFAEALGNGNVWRIVVTLGVVSLIPLMLWTMATMRSERQRMVPAVAGD